MSVCLACALLLVGGAQLALQLTLFVLLFYKSAWWGGAFSVLVGSMGLMTKWECTRMTHRLLAVMGILLNAIAAVLEMRTSSFFRGEQLFCGPPGQGTGGVANPSFGEWCDLNSNLNSKMTCACIIPGRDPGSKEACVAFEGREGGRGGEGEVCYASAEQVRRMMNVSVVLCWTMAVICLMMCVARVGVTCYKRGYCSSFTFNMSAWLPGRMRRRKRKGGPTVVVFDRPAGSSSSSGGGGGGLPAHSSSSRCLVGAGGMEAFQMQLRQLQQQQQQQQHQQEGGMDGEQGKKEGKSKNKKRKGGLADPYYMRDGPADEGGRGGRGGGGGEVEMREQEEGGGEGGGGGGGGLLPSSVV